MHPTGSNADHAAWAKGEASYRSGDRIEDGPIRANSDGFRPGSNAYAAYLTAFWRMVRKNKTAAVAVPNETRSRA